MVSCKSGMSKKKQVGILKTLKFIYNIGHAIYRQLIIKMTYYYAIDIHDVLKINIYNKQYNYYNT